MDAQLQHLIAAFAECPSAANARVLIDYLQSLADPRHEMLSLLVEQELPPRKLRNLVLELLTERLPSGRWRVTAPPESAFV